MKYAARTKTLSAARCATLEGQLGRRAFWRILPCRDAAEGANRPWPRRPPTLRSYSKPLPNSHRQRAHLYELRKADLTWASTFEGCAKVTARGATTQQAFSVFPLQRAVIL